MSGRTLLAAIGVLAALSCQRSGFAPSPCAEVDCGGSGICLLLLDGQPRCACDPGFHNAGALSCEADTHPPVEPNADAATLDRSASESGLLDSSADAGRDATFSDAPAEASTAMDVVAPDQQPGDAGGADSVTSPDARTPDAPTPDAPTPDAAHPDRGSSFDAAGWIYLAGGTYNMGCSLGDPDCENSEQPPHAVTVDSFYLLRNEVTQAQYRTVMGTNPSSFSSCGSNCPVESVSWSDARAYCTAIGGRLPSEAEWEYANRAGSTTPYSCGTLSSCIAAYAWYFANSDTGNGRQPHPVASRMADAYGLYDMSGNVWEWIEDCWHTDFTAAPSTGGAWAGGDCSLRVIRGCGWNNGERYLRVSFRQNQQPANATTAIGVRCARNAQ